MEGKAKVVFKSFWAEWVVYVGQLEGVVNEVRDAHG
jgi:hypothetical protein